MKPENKKYATKENSISKKKVNSSIQDDKLKQKKSGDNYSSQKKNQVKRNSSKKNGVEDLNRKKQKKSLKNEKEKINLKNRANSNLNKNSYTDSPKKKTKKQDALILKKEKKPTSITNTSSKKSSANINKFSYKEDFSIKKAEDISKKELLKDGVSKKIIDPVNERVIKIKKYHFRKWVKCLMVALGIFLIIGIVVWAITLYLNQIEAEKAIALKQKQEAMMFEISAHYDEYVLVKEDSILYRMDENNNYYEYGIVHANTEVILGEIEITHLTEYFYSSDLDCYIKYENLEPIGDLTEHSNRYKRYIVFNQNLITNDSFSLYDNDNNKVYSFKESMSFPIIIKNDNSKYYVEFNNRLLYVLKDDIKEFINTNNTNSKNASKVTTLCYHRIYNPNEHCKDLYICKSRRNFEKEMKYLKDNNYLTLTMEEMYLYLTKKLQIPKKSVVLTFDDGYLFKNAIEVLEEYNLNGTGFLKTAYFNDLSIYESPNFELQSHTHDMHKAGTCPRENSVQQGGGILCLPESTVLNDLKTSRDKLNGAIALAYPFYDYNVRAVKLVEKAGFKLAFIGANSVGGRSYPGINTYKVPRMTIWDTTSFEKFKSYVIN